MHIYKPCDYSNQSPQEGTRLVMSETAAPTEYTRGTKSLFSQKPCIVKQKATLKLRIFNNFC